MVGLIFYSEELPWVIMPDEEKPLLDTFYIGSVPATSPTKLLLFDVTGLRCNNCPKATVLAKILRQAIQFGLKW
jgi:hypothetical protein